MIEPRGGVIQLAYVVRPGGLDKAVDHWVSVIGAGPFFVGSFPLLNQQFRGKPTDMTAVVAVGYHGDCQVELIEATNDEPGPYNEWLALHPDIPVGGIYHHVMLDHDDYDAIVKKMLANGCTEAFEAWTPQGGRICYLDASKTIGGYLEFLDPNPMWISMCGEMRQITREWNGDRPTRSFEELAAAGEMAR